MSTWAVVPVKPFIRSKSRLAGILSPGERETLSREFLNHTLRVLAGVPEVARVLVVSRDPAALAMARDQGVHTVTEAGAPDLNAALARATQVALASGAGAVLVLPTDLPLLAADDVRSLMRSSDARVAIAPDRHETGTNALWMRPPGAVPFAFGPGSFQLHLALAAQAGAAAHVCRLPGLSLDVDEPEDLALFRASQLVE
jgi:2-phospho-L-lactate guanylyltransferase